MRRELLCSECSEKWSDFRIFDIKGRTITCNEEEGCGAIYEYKPLPENSKYSVVRVVSHGKSWKRDTVK